MLTNLKDLLIKDKIKFSWKHPLNSLRHKKERVNYIASEVDGFDADYAILVSIHNTLIYWLELAQEFNSGCGDSTEQIEREYEEPERNIVLQQQKTFQQVWQLVLDIENYMEEDEHDTEKLKDMFSRLAELLPYLWV